MKPINSKLRVAAIAAPLAAIAAGLLFAAAPALPVANHALAATSTAPVVSPETVGIANALSTAFRGVAHSVLPSVVAIENRPDNSWQAEQQSPAGRGDAFGGENPFKGTPFEDMFRGQLPMNPRQAPQSRGTSIGSGVIIDAAGVVLTNNHVVEGGGKVIVRLQDGREFTAVEVMTDPQTDIAVVKIHSDSPLPAVKLGNSDKMEVGDWVVALGQPFGLESTVTAGIVSAKNRGIGITDRESFIQTDAAINPGNSGGPLVNLQGEVIGINTAISSRDGGNNGIGFAVPSNLALWVSDQLVANGKVHRSYLGVGIQPVTHELATQLGVPARSGVVVTNVLPNSPAAKSGLETGDVIAKFDGTAISTPQQLQLEVEQTVAGKSVAISVMRNGKPIVLTYNPAEAPNDFGALAVGPQEPSSSQGRKMKTLGIEVMPLNSEIAQQLNLQDVDGVVITAVQDGSSAAKAGLQAGMVIHQVNKQSVSSVADFERIVKSDDDGSVLLLVRTEQGSQFIVVDQS